MWTEQLSTKHLLNFKKTKIEIKYLEIELEVVQPHPTGREAKEKRPNCNYTMELTFRVSQ